MSSISIIIPTFNGASRIRSTLDALTRIRNSVLEIIVVNDGSTDNTKEILGKYSEIIEVYQLNGGRASARNRGAGEARGEIFWFLDDDMVPEHDFLDRVSDHFGENPESVLVGKQIENEEHCKTDFQRYKRYLSDKWQSGLGKEKVRLDRVYLTAANMFIPSELFRKLNGFDASLTDLEDEELAGRAVADGISLFYDPELICWHKPHDNVFSYLDRLRAYEKVRKNLDNNYSPPGGSGLKSRLFRSDDWVKGIDNGKYEWMPRRLRYKLYDMIISTRITEF